jgi:Transposase DDE domain group 1
MNALTSSGLHPAGEEVFEFPAYAGKVAICPTDDLMTPFGGLVPFAAFLRHTGLLERLAESCPVERTSPNAAPIRDILVSFMLTALCEGKRFSHVERFREDPTMGTLFGIKSVVGDDAIRRLFRQMDQTASRSWVEQAITPLWRALPDQLILDWDSTVLTRYGHQQGAEIGYNPQKRGRRSHHPLVAVASGTRLCVSYRLRAGNTVSASEWEQSMSQALESLKSRPIWLNRGDIGFGQESILAWHEQAPERPRYLFKLKFTKRVQQALSRIKEEQWQGPAKHGVLQVAEIELQLHGWSTKRRVIVGRRLMGVLPKEKSGAFWDQTRHEFEAYVSNLELKEANSWQIVDLYRKRADAENVFDEIKNQWGFSGFCSRHQQVTDLAARLLLLTYNLWNLFLRLMRPEKHLEAITGRKWFLLIAARLTKSSRQSEMKLAVGGAWWSELKDGYQRICQWILSTAPQLKIPERKIVDFSFLAPAAP